MPNTWKSGSFWQEDEVKQLADVYLGHGGVFKVEVDEFKRRRHSSPFRAVAIRFLLRYAGLSQRDIADLLNIGSGSAVCKQHTALSEKLSKDRRLRRLVKQAEELLEEERCARRKGVRS